MTVALTDPDLLDRVKTIIRRDLKLGSDVRIADDMPFFSADVDLDSLDMLLLVTSIEREFGIKIPSEAVGRDVFHNVHTLTRYITENRALSPSPAPTNPLDLIPHRDPFRFVSQVLEHHPGRSAAGVWSVTGSETFFAGHFPGRPMVPGVLIAEALAQLSGLAGPGNCPHGMLVHFDIRFDQPVIPPAEIALTSQFTRAIGPLQHFDVTASVAGTLIARGILTLHRNS